VRIALEQVSEEAACGQQHGHPKRCADTVEEQEPSVLHSALPGDRRRENPKPGHEFGEHEHSSTAAAKGVLGAANTGGGFERELAEQAQHMMPMAAADEKPNTVSEQRRRRGNH